MFDWIYKSRVNILHQMTHSHFDFTTPKGRLKTPISNKKVERGEHEKGRQGSGGKKRLTFKPSLLRSLCIRQITYLVILQHTFSKMSKSTKKARKHMITLFLFSQTRLSSWRYKTGAKPCNRLNLSRTQMSALAMRLGSCGHSNKSKYAKIYFPWLDRPLWTIAPTTCTASWKNWPAPLRSFFLVGDGYCCCPCHPEW